MSGVTSYLEDRFLLNEAELIPRDSYRKGVLLDADALVALAKSDDSNHKKAVEISRFLQKRGAQFYLSPFTVAEAATVLSHKVSHTAAKNFITEARNLEKENISSFPGEHYDLADKWFLKQRKKGVSYFDCYNMALLERYQKDIGLIFSFDAIYKRNGFKTTADLDDLKRVPTKKNV